MSPCESRNPKLISAFSMKVMLPKEEAIEVFEWEWTEAEKQNRQRQRHDRK